jgi:hypothetical protein
MYTLHRRNLGQIKAAQTLRTNLQTIIRFVAVAIIIIIIVISCHRFSFFPGTSALEPVVNPTTQASSLSL